MRDEAQVIALYQQSPFWSWFFEPKPRCFGSPILKALSQIPYLEGVGEVRVRPISLKDMRKPPEYENKKGLTLSGKSLFLLAGRLGLEQESHYIDSYSNFIFMEKITTQTATQSLGPQMF